MEMQSIVVKNGAEWEREREREEVKTASEREPNFNFAIKRRNKIRETEKRVEGNIIQQQFLCLPFYNGSKLWIAHA